MGKDLSAEGGLSALPGTGDGNHRILPGKDIQNIFSGSIDQRHRKINSLKRCNLQLQLSNCTIFPFVNSDAVVDYPNNQQPLHGK